MAKIFGTIESIKSLKAELEIKGITQFKSVREINDFLSNYNSEKLEIINETSSVLEQEYLSKNTNLKNRLQVKANITGFVTKNIDIQISDLKTKIDLIKKQDSSIIKKIISNIRLYFLKNQTREITKNKDNRINIAVEHISKEIKNDQKFIKEYETEKQFLIEKAAKDKIEKIDYTRNVLENSKNLISGAIGENLVVQEIKKLSDDYILINDFNLNFSPPIYYKKKNHRIYSIQIDHLLISKAGIFIIETKNWSKSSVKSISLRSPIEQIIRSNFALYVYLSENLLLNEHHWGEQRVPIRNLIVMINNKPTGSFKFVSIKLLKELNDYLKYFEPVLSEKQLNNLINELT
jgi:hypothetical protein